MYKNIMLKISGESLAGSNEQGFDFDILNDLSNSIKILLSKNLKISIYNHTRVTTSAIAPKYSIYFGAPASADCSIISKSSTKFRAAKATMKIDKKIDALLLLLLPHHLSQSLYAFL